MYGYICPECGCYLDPGEKCDCKEEEKMREERIARSVGLFHDGVSGKRKYGYRAFYDVKEKENETICTV